MSTEDPEIAFSDLVIFDDLLPLDFSPFRTVEYSYYMSVFSTTLVTMQHWHNKYSNEDLPAIISRLKLPPAPRTKILPFDSSMRVAGRRGYVTFLNNAHLALPLFKRNNLPFILQLYPGG